MSHFHDPYRPSSAKGVDAPKAVAQNQASSEDNVKTGTTKEVLAWVGDDKVRAQRALDAEQANNSPRKGLVSELNGLLAEDEEE